ncbi:MAG: ATP phosphoribosyltransferase [Acidobacteriota bacterium]
MLTIALTKGRLLEHTLQFLGDCGIEIDPAEVSSRRLMVSDRAGSFRFLFVKAFDVPAYVEYGVADAGVCGRDVLLETSPDVHQPLDLGFGFCKIVVAGRKDDLAERELVGLRVATKYPSIAEEHFRRRGVPVEIIPLTGSIELAPLLGLAHRIVDLVETGRTLKENNLVVTETIATSSARLIVNRASFHLRHGDVTGLMRSFRKRLDDRRRPQ